MQIHFKKIHKDAKAPVRNQGDNGFDLTVVEDDSFFEDDNGDLVHDLLPGQRKLFHTGIQVEFPSFSPSVSLPGPNNKAQHFVQDDFIRLWGLVKSRSGMAAKHGIDVCAGIIDNTYTGEILVSLHNTSTKNYRIKKGDRIAQMLIMRDYDYYFVEKEELEETDRGDKGFGSSGQ